MATSIVYTKVADNIYVEDAIFGSKQFLDVVKEAIEKIASKPVGGRLIKKIAEGNHRIEIVYNRSGNNFATPLNDKAAETKGFGCDTKIYLGRKSSPKFGVRLGKLRSNFFITLAHELIHAYHFSYGRGKTHAQSFPAEVWTNDEEFSTIVGLPSKKLIRLFPKICENNIREEHGIPSRFSHKHYFKPIPQSIVDARDDHERRYSEATSKRVKLIIFEKPLGAQ